MALETATTIDGLVPTNPTHTDGVNQGDAHLRLIKATIQGTFPALSGTTSVKAADLTALEGAGSVVSGGGSSVLLITAASGSGSSGTSGSVTISGGFTVNGGATISKHMAVDSGLSVAGGVLISGGLILSSGGITTGAGINVGSGGFTGPIGTSAGITAISGISAGGVISAAGPFQGGTGQLVPQNGVILYPSAFSIPSGYADATPFTGSSTVAGYRFIYKT